MACDSCQDSWAFFFRVRTRSGHVKKLQTLRMCRYLCAVCGAGLRDRCVRGTENLEEVRRREGRGGKAANLRSVIGQVMVCRGRTGLWWRRGGGENASGDKGGGEGREDFKLHVEVEVNVRTPRVESACAAA